METTSEVKDVQTTFEQQYWIEHDKISNSIYDFINKYPEIVIGGSFMKQGRVSSMRFLTDGKKLRELTDTPDTPAKA